MASRSTTYSTARIDTLVCPVLVESITLQSCLPHAARLSLPQLPHIPKGNHPVIIEIWRVQDGTIDYGGVSAHQWWENAGGAAGLGLGGSAGAAIGAGVGFAAGAVNGGAMGRRLGPLGWWWGAVTGAAMGATIGAATAAPAGARPAARLAAEFGRRASENTSRVIGTYNEIVVTTPCRRLQPKNSQSDFAVVLGSYTDSAASVLGERLIGWGYTKLPAIGMRSSAGVLEVRTGRSHGTFKIASHGGSFLPGAAFDLSSAAPVINSLLHPWLGMLSADQPMVSYLERSLNHRDVQVAPVDVHLEASAGFIPGLGGLSADVKGSGENNPWGAFSVTGLPVTLSYPRSDNGQAGSEPRRRR